VSQHVLDKLVGLTDVKNQLKTIVDTYAYLRTRKDISTIRLSINTIIMGETGTGKTMLAEVIRDYFCQQKIIDKPKLTIVDAVDYQRFVDQWDDNIKRPRTASCSSTTCRNSCQTSTPIR
jgi:ATP-dependent protease Clp ATPase subunit